LKEKRDGDSHTFLKNIPGEYHLDSFEVNEDLSDLKKQRPTNPMKTISFQEYMRIQEENDHKSRLGNSNLVCVYRRNNWQGYFEKVRSIVLEGIGLQAERKIHVRGRYDLVSKESAEESERTLIDKLKKGELEGTAQAYQNQDYPIKTGEYPTGLIRIGMWPCLTCDMQHLDHDLMTGLITDRNVHCPWNSEILTIYAKPPFGQSANVTIEMLENGHRNITTQDKVKPFSPTYIDTETDSIQAFMHQFEREIPSKPANDPTFFSAMFATQGQRAYW